MLEEKTESRIAIRRCDKSIRNKYISNKSNDFRMNKSLIKVRFRFIENKGLIEKYSYLLQTVVQNLFCISVCFFICYNKRIFAGGDARLVAKKGEKEGRLL